MPTSLSREAYDDCYEILDRAISAERGVGASFSERGEAWHFRVRLNSARQLDRDLQKEVSKSAKSEYDILTFRIKLLADGKWWVFIERHVAPEDVTELSVG
jgi:hypothetical protein